MSCKINSRQEEYSWIHIPIKGLLGELFSIIWRILVRFLGMKVGFIG
jgi:hypothetical protein